MIVPTFGQQMSLSTKYEMVMKDIKHVKVWNLNRNDRSINVATIEQTDRKESMCNGCPSPCCRGILKPVLTGEEFMTKRFPWSLEEVPKVIQDQSTVKIDHLVVLALGEKGCFHFDPEKEKCNIFPDCPKSCLAYDCRDDSRMAEFVKARNEGRI